MFLSDLDVSDGRLPDEYQSTVLIGPKRSCQTSHISDENK